MKQYETYQEAKIANPDREIYYSAARRLGDKGFFSTIENATGFFYECKPEHYCVSLESFLASGKKLVRGDVFIGYGGVASTVAIAEVMNTPQDMDRDTYILKAKALEKLAHEWANGDECEIEMEGERGSYVFGCLVHGDDSMAIVFTDNGHMTIPTSRLLKPETPEQKLERQRLESAYHLACIAGDVGRWGDEFTFERFKLDESAVKYWLAIVDETNYLLYE